MNSGGRSNERPPAPRGTDHDSAAGEVEDDPGDPDGLVGGEEDGRPAVEGDHAPKEAVLLEGALSDEPVDEDEPVGAGT